MNRRTKWMAAVALVLAAGAVPAMAMGRGQHGGGWMESRVQAHLEEALAQAKATPAQQQAVFKERDALREQMRAGWKDHHGQMEQALDLFTADKLDPRAIATQRDKGLARQQKMTQAVAGTFQRLHGQFTPEQRKALIAYARAEMPSEGHGGWRGRMMRHMIDSKVDDALAAVKANDAQRKQILAVRDTVLKSFEDQHAARRAELEQVLTLFAADRLDTTKVDALEQQHDARARDTADAIVRAATQVHDVLTPAQRKQFADFVRSQGHGHEHGQE
jgi:Spy/CpxP family protein refolding chaperone